MVNADHLSAPVGVQPAQASAPVSDYFFGAYVTPQEQRLRCVVRNGVQHASVITPNDPLPEQPVTLAILTDAALPIDHVAVYFTADGSEPAGERGVAVYGHVALAALDPTSDQLIGETSTHCWQAQLPGQPEGTLMRYRIEAWNSANRGDPTQRWTADASDPFAAPAAGGRVFAYHVDRRQPPDWVHDAIVYHIFVDRFAAASDQTPLRDPGSITGFYGGTIRGVTEKLDYLSDLGVNCLWLSPVMESPTYHGYNPTSYAEVAQRYGSNADLRDLIAAAHTRGVRVLLDFVANHTSNEHPVFLAEQRGEVPADQMWYTFGPRYRTGYHTYYDVAGMPVLKTDTPPVRDYLIESARHWLADFGADGVRLDNVSGPTHTFWTFFQEGIKQTYPDALTVGEITGSMSDISSYAGRMDACMDFPLTKITRQVCAQRTAPLADLLAMLDAHEAEFPALMGRARLLDNHDMHRFLWLAQGDTRRLKLALTFLLTLPGFPILYYGTEVGLSQHDGPAGKDAYAREPMLWGNDQQRDLLEHTRWLIAQRNERVSLRRGRLAHIPITLTSGEVGQVGALARWTEDEATLVIFNNGQTPAAYTLDQGNLPFAWEAPKEAGGQQQAWLLTPDDISQFDGTVSAGTLPPMSAALLMVTPKREG